MLGMEGGYVLDFSNSTFSEFFEDEFGIDIYSDVYSGGGNSKANRLRTLLSQSPPRKSGQILRAIWKHKRSFESAEFARKSRLVAMDNMDPEALEFEMMPSALEDEEFERIVEDIEKASGSTSISEASEIARKFDFDTVLDEIERARLFVDDDPEDAITAACSLVESVCRSILVELGLPLPKEMSLSPLYKSVREPLGLHPNKVGIDPRIAEDVRAILGGLTQSVGAIGALRTHGGDAHGRERGVRRVDSRIARLAVNSASSLAVFLIESWNKKYPQRTLPNADAG